MDLDLSGKLKSAAREHKRLHDDVALWNRPVPVYREVRKKMPGGWACKLVRAEGEEIAKEEHKFWRRNDKAWAWYSFLIGCDLEHICEFVGGKKEELAEWIRQVCSGEAYVETHPFPLLDHQPRQAWTKRHDKILLRMRKAGLDFSEACRLLERNPDTVKREWKRLKDQQ